MHDIVETWGEEHLTTARGFGVCFFHRNGWGCCFCKGCVWENQSEEYTTARAISEILSSFSEESWGACPFHWAPREYLKWRDLQNCVCPVLVKRVNNYVGIRSLRRLLRGAKYEVLCVVGVVVILQRTWLEETTSWGVRYFNSLLLIGTHLRCSAATCLWGVLS